MATKAISIYDNAKHWIAQYESVDELKDYLDRAAAVQEYARRANDFDLEIKAAKARVRSERRCGELLQKMEKAKGGEQYHRTPATVAEVRKTIPALGLTHKQSSKYQQLAKVPEAEFEAALAIDGAIPSAHNILKPATEPLKQMDATALYFWGRLRDFEQQLFNRSLDELLDEMTPTMHRDAARILPLLRQWLGV